ncbi:MAG: helix-turn-helix domain-containing protein [Myxococcota bacterium]|nr:helix-turn-helix domain-containing protein [Myxococcota bacterium]
MRVVARLVGIGESRLRRAIREGDVPVAMVSGAWPLVRVADVEAWLASHTATPTARAEQRADEVLRREAERERRAG